MRRVPLAATWFAHLLLALWAALLSAATPPQFAEPDKLPGVVVDDTAAELTGVWKPSVHISPYVGRGYIHDDNKSKGEKSVRFTPRVPKTGSYHVLLAYTAGSTRASNVPVTVVSAEGEQTLKFDQRVRPAPQGPFRLLGTFRFDVGDKGTITISNADTDGFVIVDAVQLLSVEDAPLASLPAAGPVVEKVTVQLKKKPVAAAKISMADLDALVTKEISPAQMSSPIGDELFLRRATLDLVGRTPSLAEIAAFHADRTSVKRAELIERLLASEEFGRNWADYWTDAIAYRVPPPELTYLNYIPLRGWFAEKLNTGAAWDGVVRDLLTASGKIETQPQATFVGYHQSSAVRLASETSRLFLGVQIQCAQCHDHPFDSWSRDQFHELAAFFARSKTKLSQNDGIGTEVVSLEKGEHVMPDKDDPRKKGTEMRPVFLDGAALDSGKSDGERRGQLAQYITAPENPWFARAYVNRIWGRLQGHGFYEPVDHLGDTQIQHMPAVHDALAGHFLASGCNVKELFRLMMNSQAYQRGFLQPDQRPAETPFAAARTVRMRGDEVYATLATAIELPNFTPPKVKPTAEIRFPPPPKSTHDLVADAFGYDPSLAPVDAPRTLNQAMWMMNNEQLQVQVNAAPDSGTMLAKLLAGERDDAKAASQIFLRVLARAPSEKELQAAVEHVKSLPDRGAAFEDLLWSLLNSAEFTTKR